MNTSVLTQKQRSVLDLLVQGMSNEEIARELELSHKTVKAHITKMFRTLECDSRARIIARYYTEPHT